MVGLDDVFASYIDDDKADALSTLKEYNQLHQNDMVAFTEKFLKWLKENVQ